MPEAESNALTILGQEGVIPSELADKIRGMIGFRNILVHDYLAIDPASVHYLLTHNLGDFYAYCRAIVGFLESERD